MKKTMKFLFGFAIVLAMVSLQGCPPVTGRSTANESWINISNAPSTIPTGLVYSVASEPTTQTEFTQKVNAGNAIAVVYSTQSESSKLKLKWTEKYDPGSHLVVLTHSAGSGSIMGNYYIVANFASNGDTSINWNTVKKVSDLPY